MFKFPVISRTFQQLKELVRPQAGRSEAVPHFFYDSETYVSAVTTELSFFTNTKASRNLSNLTPAGSLPSDQEFEIYGVFLDIIADPVATSWLDVSRLIKGAGGVNGGPIWQLTISDKNYGPEPLTALGPTGGITGFSDAAAAPIQYANNGHVQCGWWADAAIVIPPEISFSLTTRWQAPVTLSGDTLLRISLGGTLHRRVL